MLNDKTWWITGASSGIGAALAQALAGAGARLILSGRNVDALEGVAKDCGDDVLILPFEVTDFERIPALVDEAWEWAEQKGGGIDGLVNNAGISQRSLATDTVFEVYQKLIDIDLLAPIALTQALLPRMVAAGGGNVVAISSVAGLVGVPLRSAYCAAKHGLIGYHDALRAETSHQGMNVLVVAPGSVRTNVSRNALDATATARGKSDAVIDAGMDPAIAAARILDAISTGRRELVLAEGMEADIVQLRRSDPNALFDAMANMIAAGYAEKLDAT
ncbi:MAG: SDR family NAD(P)-dependent oxidoreductase [Halioglobus sp.]